METFKKQAVRYNNKFDKNSTAEFFRHRQAHSQSKENSMQRANAGKIVSRDKGKQLWGKTIDKREKTIDKRESNINCQTNVTKNSLATECS